MKGKSKGIRSGASSVKLITPARVSVPSKTQVDNLSLVAKFRPVFSRFKYPINNPAELVKSLKSVSRIPISFFPIHSAKDFEDKVSQFLKPGTMAIASHPTSVSAPMGRQRGK